MSCLGGSRQKGRGDDWGGVTQSEDILDMDVLDVDGIMSGKVPLDFLWVALQKVDHWLENQWSVLIYCAHGAHHSAFVTACYLKSKCIPSMKPYRLYRNAEVIGHLRMVRRVVVKNLDESLNWAWFQYFMHSWSPCHRKTPLPFIFSDEDFKGCCSGSFPDFHIFRADRAEGLVDKLGFVTASGQEDKSDQQGDGKRGKGQKGITPTAAGQGGKGRRGKTLTALGQEGKKGGEVIPMTDNEAVGKGKKRKRTIELENQRLQA